MTTQIVTDEQLGKLSRRMHDLFERVRTGGVNFDEAMSGLQQLADTTSQTEVGRWQKFYNKVFGESLDFSNIHIPEKPGDDWWLIILAKGMTPEKLLQKCREKFGVWKWTNDSLDEIVISDRAAKDVHYAIWVKSNVEADEEFKNISANQLKEQGHNGITLEERLVLELLYFWRTKKHLDIQNWTLCSGSRYASGNVPSVSWSDDKMGVDWCDPDYAVGRLRSRQAVS
ncbi:MAG: hypothetical protein ACD_15C00077G0006 [uncultured bacterium]|nr:MAG: hypothetical protein ACD_15C00077G0006 [uncultured bacterium]